MFVKSLISVLAFISFVSGGGEMACDDVKIIADPIFEEFNQTIANVVNECLALEVVPVGSVCLSFNMTLDGIVNEYMGRLQAAFDVNFGKIMSCITDSFNSVYDYGLHSIDQIKAHLQEISDNQTSPTSS